LDPLRTIAIKRDDGKLSSQEIDAFVQGFVRGDIPDHQAAALLMAIFIRGMDEDEVHSLTSAFVRSGTVMDLSSVGFPVVDKHSTGGVGDKTTLVVAPLVAAAGVHVGKMSGRGLGFTGGTLDKLESIPGFQVNLSARQFVRILVEHHIVVSGQTPDLAPADGKFYALRDMTSTVESIPLIASSITSKKIASGASAFVLDVKVGLGSLTRHREGATALADLISRISERFDRQVSIVMGKMDQPLGRAVGNALEVMEAVEALRGKGARDLQDHCMDIACRMWLLANRGQSEAAARRAISHALSSGKALSKFQEWIKAQGGQADIVQDASLLPRARLVRDIPSQRAGYVATLDARKVGIAAMKLGAGRRSKSDSIDHSVGAWLHAKVGDRVSRGDSLFTVHASDEEKLSLAAERIALAYHFQDDPPIDEGSAPDPAAVLAGSRNFIE
jgi:pyrimidine-nucleoside phosphorylase